MKYAIITDANVAALYNIEGLIVPAGESSKSIEMVQYLASQLAEQGYGRNTTIIGIGGGMVTDLAGFVASTFCRGVPLILIPTTLLAMVDAAIGGKAAVNIPDRKNLLGSFILPEKVILHLPFLETLPDVEWENGVIEILKIGLLVDPYLFYHFSHIPLHELVHRAIEAKRRIVARDLHDKGARGLLNLGHTVGHALEALSGYTLPHGKAVGYGIVIEARISHAMGILSRDDLEIIEAHFPPVDIHLDGLLQKLGQPFVLLKKIGEPFVENEQYKHTVPYAIIKEVLDATCLCSC